MYEDFYHLKEPPFSLLPDPSFLYLSSKHKRALSLLQYAVIKNYGIITITGEIGTGKTTLLRQLLNSVDDNVKIGLISNTHNSFSELLKWVFVAYGLDYKNKDTVELYDEFVNFVIQEYANNHKVVLIIDEAQNMSVSALEELRMLSNINADKHQALQMILVGQPELRNILLQPTLKQLVQRVAAAYHLTALEKDEVALYIRHRLQLAGCDESLFEPGAIDKIWEHSQGIPRVINILCDTALVEGFVEQTPTISAEVLDNVIQERLSTGLFQHQVNDAL